MAKYVAFVGMVFFIGTMMQHGIYDCLSIIYQLSTEMLLQLYGFTNFSSQTLNKTWPS